MKRPLMVVAGIACLAVIFTLTFRVLSSLGDGPDFSDLDFEEPDDGQQDSGNVGGNVAQPEPEPADTWNPPASQWEPETPPEPQPDASQPEPAAVAVEPLSEPVPVTPVVADTADAEPATRPGFVTIAGELVTWMPVAGELVFQGQKDGEGVPFSAQRDGRIEFPADLPLARCEAVLRLGKGLQPRIPLEIPPYPVDIEIALEAYNIVGEVHFHRRGVEMATVRLVDTEDFESVYDTQVTNPDGQFSFGPLVRGQYRLECLTPDDRPTLAGQAFNLHISRNHDNIVIELVESGGLAGTLFDDRGNPVLQGRVVVKGMDDFTPPGGSVQVFGNGRYEIANLAPGIYEVTGYGQPPLAVKERVQVLEAQQTGFDLKLKAPGGILVIVENARKEPQAGCKIFVTPMGLTPEPPEDWDAPDTSEQGVSEVLSLAPGDYFVTAEDGMRRAVSGMLRIESGDTREVRLELPE